MRTRSKVRLALVAALTGFVAMAGSVQSPDSSATTTAGGTSAAPVANLDRPDIEGLYDVGGHRLYLACSGDGPVTVIYVHGWVNDTGTYRTTASRASGTCSPTTTASASTTDATSDSARPSMPYRASGHGPRHGGGAGGRRRRSRRTS